MNKYCILIIGPSGSGKSTLEKTLVTVDPTRFRKAISFTTREPRIGEVDGYDYHFLNQEQFDNTEKVEHITFGSNHYGLSKEEFSSDITKHIICVVEPTGAGQIVNYLKNSDLPYKPVIVYMDIDLEQRIENMRDGRNHTYEEIKSRLEIDKIPEQFEELYPTYMAEVYSFLRINKLYPFLYKDVLDFLDEYLQVTFFSTMDGIKPSDLLTVSNKWTWLQPEYKSFLNTSMPHIYAKVTNDLDNRIICNLYGSLRDKFLKKFNDDYLEYM